MSSTQKGLQQLMDDLNRVTKRLWCENQHEKDYGHVHKLSCKGNCRMKILINVQLAEQVSEFRYLGSLMSEDGYCEKEIHNRTAVGKKIFMDKNRQIKLEIEETNYNVSSLEHSTCMLQRLGC